MGLNLSIGAVIVHIILWHGKEISKYFRDYIKGVVPDDAHFRAMKLYPEVPSYWYIGLFIIAFVIAIVTSIKEDSHMPVWALVVALLFAFLTLPFYGAFYAITGFNVSFQNLYQIFGAALIPGSAQANMYFELYSSNTLGQAAGLLSDLKLGQYTKRRFLQCHPTYFD